MEEKRKWDYDVAVIGAGVCGAAIARVLSGFRLKVAVLEKDTDVANGTSKANSGIVHAGYDPLPGTKMAKYNVEGNAILHQLTKELDIPFRETGSLVVAFSEEEKRTLEELLERGRQNGVPGLQLLTAEETWEKEPNLSREITGALYAPTAGVISPWELAIAQLEVAVTNGVELFLETEVQAISQTDGGFVLQTVQRGTPRRFTAAAVVNAAGVYSDLVCAMVSGPSFRIIPNKGQYYLLDKNQGGLVRHVVFQCPNRNGKGVLVSPTVHGNLIVGPDAVPGEDRDDVSTSAGQLAFVRRVASKTCGQIDFRQSIRNFAGVRAQGTVDEFVIGPVPESDRFINVANIKSPGLTSSPAIALDVAEMLQRAGIAMEKKENAVTTRRVVRFKELSAEEKNEWIRRDPRYGRVICRCETVTEGEIAAAIHSPVPARTVDAVKRRCGAGMGRCQGGFCSPRVVEMIARELQIPATEVEQDKKGSVILTGHTAKGTDGEKQ